MSRASEVDPVIGSTRILAAALLGGVLLAAAMSFAFGTVRSGGAQAWALAAGILGLLAPVIGYRLFRSAAERPGTAAALRRATLIALAVTEAAALLGIAGFALTRAPICLTGVAAHLLLTGAIWPSPKRWAALRPARER